MQKYPLVIASNNKNKIKEIKEILGASFDGIYAQSEVLPEIDIIEDGNTFTENAYKKASEIQKALKGKYAVLSDDSGLSVDFLNGAPGVYSARFASLDGGKNHDDKANNDKLLSLLYGVDNSKRTAKFVCAMVLLRKGLPDISVVGECKGYILNTPLGENGFGYDPLFYYPQFETSFACLTPEQKNMVSHRKRALEKVLLALSDSEYES